MWRAYVVVLELTLWLREVLGTVGQWALERAEALQKGGRGGGTGRG